jgi:hypothetical protein
MGTCSRCGNKGGVLLTHSEPSAECVQSLTSTGRLLLLLKENRLEAMIVTILVYSTGLLDKAVTYGHGVCS